MPAVENARSRRGRPVGSGIDDENALRKLAAFLVEHPNAKRSVAIRQACGLTRTDDTVLHRLNRKWRMQRERLLAEVRAREAEDCRPEIKDVTAQMAKIAALGFVPALNVPQLCLNIPRVPPEIALALSGAGAFANSPALKAIAALHRSPAFEAAHRMHEAMRAFENSWMGTIRKVAQ